MKHHVMLTVVAVVCGVAFTSRASAQAAASPSAVPSSSMRRASAGPTARHPCPAGPSSRCSKATRRGRPAHLAPQVPAKLPRTAALARRSRARDLLSGTLNVGMGEQPTYSGGTALSAGSYAVMPLKMVHYAWTEATRRLPAPQRRALEHHLRESKRRPATGAAVTDVLFTARKPAT